MYYNSYYTTLQNVQSHFWFCVQMLQRVVLVAAESLKVLEHQLMDGSQIQDIRVSKKHFNAVIHSPLHCIINSPLSE